MNGSYYDVRGKMLLSFGKNQYVDQNIFLNKVFSDPKANFKPLNFE